MRTKLTSHLSLTHQFVKLHLKTPAKDKPLESVLKTPVVVSKKDVCGQPIVKQSPGTTSNDTPKSTGEKRSSKPVSNNIK